MEKKITEKLDKNGFIFSKANLKKAKDIISKYPEGRQKSAVLPLLDLAQRQNDGWLSKEVIEYVADLLSLSVIRVYEIASFYTMFNLKKIGKYHLQVCGTTPCWLKGAKDVMNICKKYSEKHKDKDGNDIFSVSEVECLGACVDAPIVQINDDYYENLDKDSTVKILDKILKKEQK